MSVLFRVYPGAVDQTGGHWGPHPTVMPDWYGTEAVLYRWLYLYSGANTALGLLYAKFRELGNGINRPWGRMSRRLETQGKSRDRYLAAILLAGKLPLNCPKQSSKWGRFWGESPT